MERRAVILAGGRGTRMQPYTVVLPKPLMPVGDYPILEIIVRQLAYYGFTHLTMAVNHQAAIIRDFFGSGDKWNVTIDYSLEDKPLSTMGPLRLIEDLPSDFLVMNGDILTDLDFGAFYDYHVCRENLFTISAYQREQKSEYGILEADRHNRLRGFQEKPIVLHDVSMGVYMVSKRILQYIPEGRPYGFDDLMSDLIDSKNFPHLKRFRGYWLDIGRPDDYARAVDEFKNMQERLSECFC